MSSAYPIPPRRYGSRLVFGPFHRSANAGTQGAHTMRRILASGELWGRRPRFGVVPAVQAFAGPLPSGETGFEFFAYAEPDRPYGGVAYWRARADKTVSGDDTWAKLKVLVGRVEQEY